MMTSADIHVILNNVPLHKSSSLGAPMIAVISDELLPYSIKYCGWAGKYIHIEKSQKFSKIDKISIWIENFRVWLLELKQRPNKHSYNKYDTPETLPPQGTFQSTPNRPVLKQ